MDALDRVAPVVDTLFGVAHARPGDAGRVGVLGVPFDLGNAVAPGCRAAPGVIRRASRNATAGVRDVPGDGPGYPSRAGSGREWLDGPARRVSAWIRDHGDVVVRPGEDTETVAQRVAKVCRAMVASGARPLVIGGDHSISYGVVSGLAAAGPLIVAWLDAHTDIDEKTLRVGLNHKNAARRIAALPHVARVVAVGHRGYTREDETRCLPGRLVVVTARELRVRGPSSLLDALDGIDPRLPVYVSIDIDVVSPAYAPGTATPVPGGPGPAEIAAVVEVLSHCRELVGCDLVEINPDHDDGGRTVRVACELLGRAAGALAIGGQPAAAARSRRGMP